MPIDLKLNPTEAMRVYSDIRPAQDLALDQRSDRFYRHFTPTQDASTAPL
jgi:hypothetical protein